MRLRRQRAALAGASAPGFTIVETLVSMLVLGLACAGVYSGIAASFRHVQASRESLRATQIVVQTMEVVRLCTWSQSDPSTGILPKSFTAFYDNADSNSLAYQVTVTLTNAPGVAEAYAGDLRMVSVTASWTENNVAFKRTINTYVAKPGMVWYAHY